MPPRNALTGRFLLAFFLIIVVGSCDSTEPDNDDPPLPSGPLFEVLGEVSNDQQNGFERFHEAASRAGLNASIGGSGNATFFIPDDEAFHLMSPETLDGLADQQGVLRKVLLRHIVQGSTSLADLSDGQILQTAEGTPLTVTIDDEGTVFLNGVHVEEQIGTTNRGPVYRIKSVFRNHLTIEERVAASPLLEHASRLFGEAGSPLTQPGTFFIPIDPGFEQYPGGGVTSFDDPDNRPLLQRTLEHLVISDREVSSAELVAEQSVPTAVGTDLRAEERDGVVDLSSADVAFAGEIVPLLVRDIQASNGVFHLIERPLQGHLTLWERIDFFDGLQPFAAMLEGAGMQEVLQEQEGLTVFAPLRTAFDSLGTRGVEQLMSTEDTELRQLLAEFHLSPSDVASSAFEEDDEGNEFPSLAGQVIRVHPHWIDGVTALAMSKPSDVVDLPARNGRLHFVQSFLNPSTPTSDDRLISTLNAYDQLLLSGAAPFRAIVQMTGYADLARGPDPISILAPSRIDNRYFQAGYECRAIELAEDHISPGSNPISEEPMIMLNNHQVYFLDWNHTGPGGPAPIPATLFEPGADVDPDPIPPDWEPPVPLGITPWFYRDFQLENGSFIHGVVEQMRWYGSGPIHQTPPPCP